MLPLLRKTLMTAAALAAAAALGACATTPAPTTIADTAARTPQLTTLTRLINEAGLADTLRAAGPYTVFAPSDEAFKAVPAKTMQELSSNKALLASVLKYHLIAAKLNTQDVKPGNVKTVLGDNVAVATAGSFVTVEDAVVQTADLAATNGVIHIVDRVLIPPKK